MDEQNTRVRVSLGADVIELDIAPYLERFIGAGTLPTVDEVQAGLLQFGDLPGCRVRQIGSSPAGEPLRVLSVGRGEIPVLVLAGVHPNEPVGYHTLFALARVVRDSPALESVFTFHLVGCWDADAARRNRWYQGPLTIEGYHRGFYRPPLGWQPCWTFPIPGWFEAPRSETWAVMRFCDEVQPQVVLELHNGDFGGTWFVVNQRPPTDLADELRAAVTLAGVPVKASGSDVLGWESEGDGVFIMPPIEQLVASMSGAEGPRRHGAAINHYLPGAFVIAPEVPLWNVDDLPHPATGYREATARTGKELDEAVGFLGDCLTATEVAMPGPTVFRPAVSDTLASAHELAAKLKQPDEHVSAAEYTGAVHALHMLRLRAAGMLLRILEAETAAGNVHPAIRTTTGRVEQQFADWCRTCDTALRPRPFALGQGVRIQLHAGLLAAAHAARRRR